MRGMELVCVGQVSISSGVLGLYAGKKLAKQ